MDNCHLKERGGGADRSHPRPGLPQDYTVHISNGHPYALHKRRLVSSGITH